MGNGSGVSRGDRNRNARLERLRALVPVTNAIAGIDLAGKKQMVVVTDHDSKVIARRTFRCRAWDLGSALDWAADRAVAAGWAGVTVSCEPTGHRWRVLGQLAADRSMPFVCVQPVVTSWSRRTEELTCDKTDDKDAVLTAQLRCYVPEPVDETWGRLRHLGTRREQLITEAGAPQRLNRRPAHTSHTVHTAGNRPCQPRCRDRICARRVSCGSVAVSRSAYRSRALAPPAGGQNLCSFPAECFSRCRIPAGKPSAWPPLQNVTEHRCHEPRDGCRARRTGLAV
jgi:hypothetical protein